MPLFVNQDKKQEDFFRSIDSEHLRFFLGGGGGGVNHDSVIKGIVHSQ